MVERSPRRRGLKVIRRVREDFLRFLHLEVAGAAVLLAATVTALVLANSGFSHGFQELWHLQVGFVVGDFEVFGSLLHWIDDALMAIFFFVVGLEIKREFIVGELSSPRNAVLPIVAAIGGMAAPAILYMALNAGGEGVGGWGIPMATDIAFALGVLALLGSRVPPSLKVFLTALAIADDIGAVLVIAIFYTSGILWLWLLAGLALVVLLLLLNYLGVESPIPYLLIGTLVWIVFFYSGVHATIAGVLVALTVPSRSKKRPLEFVEWTRKKLEEIQQMDVPGEHVLTTDDQQVLAREIRGYSIHVEAPLQRLEHALHPLTTFLILPLFALANAGVSFSGEGVLALLAEPVALGVIVGLVLGKQIGIMGLSYLAVKFRLASLPQGVEWHHIWGVSWLAGIGFTMSMFVAGLAFGRGDLLAEAKVGILAASLFAGVAGYAFLRFSGKREVA